MISGHATPADTRKPAQQFSGPTRNLLGEAGRWVSGAGFGCCRVNAGVVSHEKAFGSALAGERAGQEHYRRIGQAFFQLIEGFSC